MHYSISRLFLLATTFLATTFLSECHADFVLRGWGGASWVHHSTKEFDATYNPGYAVGVACGGTWFKLLRTEIEVLRFHNTLNHVKVDSVSSKLKGDLTATAGLFNVEIHCPLTLSRLCISPYFGGGVGGGYAKTKLHAHGLPKMKDSQHHSVYQVFGGISTLICPLKVIDLSFEIEGRFLGFDKHLYAGMVVGGLTAKF